jgi:hypothetical protein
MARSDPRDLAVAAAIDRYKAGSLQQYAGKRYSRTGEPRTQGETVTNKAQAIAIALSEAGVGTSKKHKAKRIVPGSTARARREGASGGLGKSGGGRGGGGGGGF